MIDLTCPHCRNRWPVSEVSSGFAVLCPSCGMPVDLPVEALAVHESTGMATKQKAKGIASLLSPPQAEDEIGRLGGYRVLEMLGEGGMGLVFRAEDVKLRRIVALKIMRPQIAMEEVSRQRFLREAQVTAALDNDHIIPIFQVGEENGVPFIAMPELKGETLHRRLENAVPMSVMAAMHIGREMAEGLAAAHAMGIIHRDIKPTNIWLEEPCGRVKILDFGLARLADHSDRVTSTGSILGSPSWMAPEQAAGRGIGTHSDLFSLGCILYQMTTGRKPFPGGDVMAILSALANTNPPPASSLNPDVPAELSNLIGRLLEKDPVRRPRSAREVADTLAAMVPPTESGATTRAIASPFEETKTELLTAEQVIARRRAMRWPIIAVVAVVVMFIAIVVWSLQAP